MVDEQEPPKRPVKRVVKKTVVRPTAPGQAKPQVRYGRPVATATKTRTPKPRSGKTSAGKTSAGKPTVTARATVQKSPAQKRSPRDLGAKVTAGGRRAGDAWTSLSARAGSAARTSGSVLSTRARAVAAWRLPHINLYLASVITGVVVGVVAVLLGVIALQIFDAVRGVSAGGGLWGGVAFIAIAAAAVLGGDALLRGFGSTSARVTSFLAVVLSVVAMLGLFLDLLDRQPSTAVFLVPALGAVTFVASHWLVTAAEKTPTLVE